MGEYRAGLLDRLLDGAAPRALSLEQFKDALARDLEDLLNTRAALAPPQLADWPLCQASVLNYGLSDFAGLSLTSSEDRDRICASVRQALQRYEPRLRNVQVKLAPRQGAVNRIDLVIAGTLLGAQVSFSAMLQPSSLHYSITRGAIA